MGIQDSLGVVKKYWDSAPVNVLAIANDLDLPVTFRPLEDNISGMLICSAGKCAILVNSEHSNTRRRFTIAHEIGHFIYHRDLLDGGIGDTIAFRAEGRPMDNPRITAVHEQQANNFAANLLMPNPLISKLRAQGLNTPEQLANALQVSVQAMRIKLGLNRPVVNADPEDNEDGAWAEPHL